jgi:hypothetical protein
VKDHPLLRDLVFQTEGLREEGRRAAQAAAEARAHKRRLTILLSLIAVGLFGGGGGVLYYLSQKPQVVYRERIKEVGGEELHVEFSPLKVDPPNKGKHHRGPGVKGQKGDEFSDVTNLGDATSEGGDETLGQDVVQNVMQHNYAVLKGCILEEKHRNPGLKTVEMEFIIRGSGQVSAVRVNGQQGTPFASCMYGKMQTVAFPKFNGSRTHASFSLAFK